MSAGKSFMALVIPVDPEEPIHRVEVVGDTLTRLQELVSDPDGPKGYIEAVPYPPGPDADALTTYVNEEGKLNGMPRNERATALMKPGLFPNDWIAGPLVICGFNPETGESTDIPDWFESRGHLVPTTRLGRPA